METVVSASCEQLLNEEGRIVGPCAINRSVSRQETEMISRKCRTNHATQTYFWRKTRTALRHEAANYRVGVGVTNVLITLLMSSRLLDIMRHVTFGSLAAGCPPVLFAVLDFMTLSVLRFTGPRCSQ